MASTTLVKSLVTSAMKSIPTPYAEDVILRVCQQIKSDSALMKLYDAACNIHGRAVTNQAIGRYVKIETGMKTVKQVNAPKDEIVGSYSKLTH